MMNRMGFGGGGFAEYYKCHPIGKLSAAKQPYEYSGKIILPTSALAKLAALHIEYPMLFQLQDEQTGKTTHAGVIEFVAPEGHVYMPTWIMETLQCEEGDIIRVINATLPLGKFLKIQPQSVDFLDIHDPKAVLEQALRQYSTVTQGDIIPINYNNKIYRLLCAEVKPGNRGVSIVETDLEVDFAPPVGYVEPTKTSAAVIGRQQSMASSVLSVDEHTVHDDGEGGDDAARRWRAFEGTGKRLNERKHSSVLSRSAAAAAAVNSNVTESSNGGSGNEKENNAVDSSTPAALRIPPNKLWFGYKVEPATPGDKDAQNGKKLPPAFEGKGFSLRRA